MKKKKASGGHSLDYPISVWIKYEGFLFVYFKNLLCMLHITKQNKTNLKNILMLFKQKALKEI